MGSGVGPGSFSCSSASSSKTVVVKKIETGDGKLVSESLMSCPSEGPLWSLLSSKLAGKEMRREALGTGDLPEAQTQPSAPLGWGHSLPGGLPLTQAPN